jgi:microcystin-dependent protein
MGEIRIVGFNFAPQGWAACNGQLLAINEYEPLFTLLGTTYGGDGVNTFAVPNMNGRAVVGAQGQGPGLSNYPPGTMVGTEGVTLTSNQLPTHGHTVAVPLQAVSSGTATASAVGNFPAVSPTNKPYAATATAGAALNAQALTVTVGVAGGSVPHSNMQPVLALNYIIATQGIYPSQP